MKTDAGQLIRVAREGQRRTGDDVAKAIGVDPATLSRIEQGKVTPPLVTVERLRRAVSAAEGARDVLAVALLEHDHATLQGIANRIGLRVIVDGDTYGVTVEYGEEFARLV